MWLSTSMQFSKIKCCGCLRLVDSTLSACWKPFCGVVWLHCDAHTAWSVHCSSGDGSDHTSHQMPAGWARAPTASSTRLASLPNVQCELWHALAEAKLRSIMQFAAQLVWFSFRAPCPLRNVPQKCTSAIDGDCHLVMKSAWLPWVTQRNWVVFNGCTARNTLPTWCNGKISPLQRLVLLGQMNSSLHSRQTIGTPGGHTIWCGSIWLGHPCQTTCPTSMTMRCAGENGMPPETTLWPCSRQHVCG